MPTTDWETGRSYNWHYPSKVVRPGPLVGADTQVAIIRTEFIRQRDAGHAEHRETLLRHIVEDRLTPGRIRLEDRYYPHDPKAEPQTFTMDFQSFDRARIETPTVEIWDHANSCGGYNNVTALRGGQRYLAIIDSRYGEPRIIQAAPIKSKRDPIVEAYRLSIAASPNAPDRMDAAEYFSHMQDYVELEVMHCPTWEEMRFKESLYGTKEKQAAGIYRMVENARETRTAFDIRDALSYRQQVRGGSSQIEYPLQDCQFGDRWLYVAPAKGNGRSHFFMLDNGRINTAEIGTRITITGPDAVLAENVKGWIGDAREARASD